MRNFLSGFSWSRHPNSRSDDMGRDRASGYSGGDDDGRLYGSWRGRGDDHRDGRGSDRADSRFARRDRDRDDDDDRCGDDRDHGWGWGHHDRDDDRDHGCNWGWHDRDDDDHDGCGGDDDDDDGDGGGCGLDGDGDDDCGCGGLTPTDEFGEPVVTNRIGTAGDDSLTGDCTNDNIVGSWGNDTLSGGGGADGLSGNWGTDVLTGGCGPDMFVFDGNFDTDIVTDFSREDGDHIKFVIYPSQGIDPTAAELLALARQIGDDVLFLLPESDETAIIQNTRLADITLDMIAVEFVPAPEELVA